MPFGLKISPANWQRILDNILGNSRFKYCMAYMDDIIVFSKTFEDHLEHLKCIFQLLKESGININPSKLQLCKIEVKYLGFIISKNSRKPDPEKLYALANLKTKQDGGKDKSKAVWRIEILCRARDESTQPAAPG